MEAAMASEATKKDIPGYTHIDTRVIEVACIKSKVKLYLLGLWGCVEAAIASEATYITGLGQLMQIPQ